MIEQPGGPNAQLSPPAIPTSRRAVRPDAIRDLGTSRVSCQIQIVVRLEIHPELRCGSEAAGRIVKTLETRQLEPYSTSYVRARQPWYTFSGGRFQKMRIQGGKLKFLRPSTPPPTHQERKPSDLTPFITSR
jgi:hypothetical protein